MKLGKIRKLLVATLALGLISSQVLAEETTHTAVTSTAEAVSESSGSAEAWAETSMVMEENIIPDDEKIAYLEKHGEAVGASVEKDNIKITIEYIIADAYTYQMLISCETIDGVPFKGDEDRVCMKSLHIEDKRKLEIGQEKEKLLAALPEDAELIDYLKIEAQFSEEIAGALKKYTKADGTLDVEGFGKSMSIAGNTSWGGASSGYGLCDTKKNTASKKYYIYEGSTHEAVGNELMITMDSVTQEKEVSYDITKTIMDYLVAHKNEKLATVPLEVTDEEKTLLEQTKADDKMSYESYKQELENRPKEILTEGTLDISVIPDDRYSISNMGFVNNQFHIRFKGETKQYYNLEVSNKDKEELMRIYNVYQREEEEDVQATYYEAYAIKDLDELKQYTFKLTATKVLEETKGPLEIAFTLKPFPEPKTINIQKRVPYYEDKEMLVKSVTLNAHSLSLTLAEIEKGKNTVNTIQVKLKDGTTQEIHSSAHYGNKLESTYIYSLNNIQREDLKGIIVQAAEITLQ